MNPFTKGSDLLSKRMFAMSSLIVALGNIGLSPIIVIPISIAIVYMLRK